MKRTRMQLLASTLLAAGLAIISSAGAQMGQGPAAGKGEPRSDRMPMMMRDMSGMARGMSEQMGRGSMTPEQQQQMAARMQEMSGMMENMSGMMGNCPQAGPDMQRRMDQMHSRMQQMRREMPGAKR